MDSARLAPSYRPITMPLSVVVIAGLFLIYRLAAAFDFSMSMLVGEAFYRQSGMSEAHIYYFLLLPSWVIMAWSLSIWCGLAGAMAVFLKPKLALPLLSVALIGATGYACYTLLLSNGRDALGMMWFMPLISALYTLVMMGIAYRYPLHQSSDASII